jgi:hypothetical protein
VTSAKDAHVLDAVQRITSATAKGEVFSKTQDARKRRGTVLTKLLSDLFLMYIVLAGSKVLYIRARTRGRENRMAILH